MFIQYLLFLFPGICGAALHQKTKTPPRRMHILVVIMRREQVSNYMSRGSKYNREKTKK